MIFKEHYFKAVTIEHMTILRNKRADGSTHTQLQLHIVGAAARDYIYIPCTVEEAVGFMESVQEEVDRVHTPTKKTATPAEVQ